MRLDRVSRICFLPNLPTLLILPLLYLIPEDFSIVQKRRRPSQHCACKGLPKIQDLPVRGPKDLISEGLDPQREETDDGATAVLHFHTPAAPAEPLLVEFAKVQPTNGELGISDHIEAMEGYTLTGRLEVSEDEACDEGGRAEGRQVMRRKPALPSKFSEKLHLRDHALRCAPRHDARNPEREAIA